MKRILTFLMALTLLLSLLASTGVHTFAAQTEPLYEAVYDGKSEFASTGAAAPLTTVGDDGELQVPKIEVNTENSNGASLEKADGYVNADITITDTDGSTLSGAVSFKVRGNSTAMTFVTKKAFTFKFDKKKEVLGMGKGKKWALLANCFDPTLLRNYLAFDFAKELGLPYTSEQRIVELWLDGSYHGCYSLYEPVQEGTDRVDIDIDSNDGMKDFLIENEATRYESDVTYVTIDGMRFAISEPEEPTADQKAYVTGVLNDIVNTLKNGTEEEIRQKVDIDSFAKFYLLNEYAKTVDFGFSSVFFFYKDGLLYAGPPWDYDLALGNLNAPASDASREASKTEDIFQSGKVFYKYLSGKDWFENEIKRVYAEHYDYIENIAADGGLLDSFKAEYGEVFDRNFTVWNVGKWWLNYQRPPVNTYDGNYQVLKNWCGERNAWLTDYYGLSRYSYLCGDADGNGLLEIIDATIIQRVLANLMKDDDGMIALRAGVTGEELNILDATMIQRYNAHMTVPYDLDTEKSVMLY